MLIVVFGAAAIGGTFALGYSFGRSSAFNDIERQKKNDEQNPEAYGNRSKLKSALHIKRP